MSLERKTIMQTKKQKQQKALAYWENEVAFAKSTEKKSFEERESYIYGQIKILKEKLGISNLFKG